MSVTVTGPDQQEYQFPDGTDKSAAIKYFKAKGIGGGKAGKSEGTGGYKVPPAPTIASLSGTSTDTKTDKPASQPVDRSPIATLKRAGGIIKSDIENLPSTIDRFVKDVGTATAPPGKQSFGPLIEDVKGAARGLYNISTPGIAGTLARKEDVAPVIAGATELTVPGALLHEPGPGAKTAAPETKALPDEPQPAVPEAMRAPLTAEQQEAYTKALDKANAEHAQALSDYAKQIGKVQKAKGTTTTPFQEAGPERSAAAREAVTNRKAVLERGSKEYMGRVRENIRSTHQTVRARLDSRWNSWREGMKGAQVPSVDVYNVVQEAQEKLRGAPASLKQFNDLIRETGIKLDDEGNLISSDTGLTMAADASDMMDVETARVHSSAIGDKLAAGDLPGNVYQALKLARNGMEDIVQEAADLRGRSAEYKELKADWHQYMEDWKDLRTGGSSLAKAMRGEDPHFVSDQVLGKEGSQLMERMSKYRKHGANPGLAAAARRLANEAKEIKVPTPRVAPKMPRKPTLEAPARPKPAEGAKASHPAVPAKFKIGGRLAGKVIGGAIGSAAGHPFLGYGAGGELGGELVQQWWKRRKFPPPGP